MKIYVIGKVNQTTGSFYYLHIFVGHKVEDKLFVDESKLFYTEDNDFPKKSYGASNHKEQKLNDWLVSIIKRVFMQGMTEGEWTINL